jgi:RHS repeat-associated protein
MPTILKAIVKLAKGETTHYVFQGTEPILEKNITIGKMKSFVYALGKHLARVDGAIGDPEAKKYWYITDHLGSVRAVTDVDGKKVWSTDYLAFGTQFGKSAETDFEELHSFTGKELDPDTGLHYYNARWYDSELGRFVSEDPVGDPNNPNLYAYGRNNPLGFIDPTGLRYEGYISQSEAMAIHAANTSSSSSNHDGTGGGSPSGGSSSRQEKDGNNGQKGNDIGNDKPNEVDMDIVKKQELQMKYEELRDLVTQFFREMLNAETEESFSGFYHEWSFYVRQLAEVESQLGISNFVQDISQKGVEFIADYEQLKTEVYDDACGNPTIGYGHLIKPDENFDNGITKEEALQLLKQDLQIAVKAVRDNITVPLTQQQFAYFGQTGHRFRFKLDRHSGSKWTVIPDQTGQFGAKRRTKKLA